MLLPHNGEEHALKAQRALQHPVNLRPKFPACVYSIVGAVTFLASGMCTIYPAVSSSKHAFYYCHEQNKVMCRWSLEAPQGLLRPWSLGAMAAAQQH